MHTHDKTGQVTGKPRSRPARVPTPVAPGAVPLGRRVSPRRPILRLRANADRSLIEATVAALIDLLDARDAPMVDREPDLYLRDADPDAEPDHDGEQDNEDCCSARDDEPRAGGALGHSDHRPGAEDDAESSLGWPEQPGRRGALDQSCNMVGDHTTDREHDRCDDEEDDDRETNGDDEPSFQGCAMAARRASDPAVVAARARHAAKPRRATPGVVWL